MAKFYVEFANATIALTGSSITKAKNCAGEWIRQVPNCQGDIHLLDSKMKRIMLYDKWGALWIKLEN